MSKRLIVQRLRDGALVFAAFAMVLYVTIGDHRLSTPDRQLEADAGSFVGGGLPKHHRPDGRIASIQPEAILP